MKISLVAVKDLESNSGSMSQQVYRQSVLLDLVSVLLGRNGCTDQQNIILKTKAVKFIYSSRHWCRRLL